MTTRSPLPEVVASHEPLSTEPVGVGPGVQVEPFHENTGGVVAAASCVPSQPPRAVKRSRLAELGS